jgi:predicted nucleotidyltransferase
MMGVTLNARRDETTSRFDDLRSGLTEAEKLCKGKACVYATGSFARGEAHQWSDLDLFIVGQSTNGRRDLRRLDEICMKADLIEATQAKRIPEFSGDGRYLEHYTVGELIGTLGKPEDDVTNTFTARLLLLLESRPLLEITVYDHVIEDVVGAYWQDFEDHKNDFTPTFLVNDILRLWRTFCVNYEARTRREPAIEKAKRKLKNYKLKFSRLLTCYSALLYLLAIHTRSNTVTPEDATHMVSQSPTERLEWLLYQSDIGTAHEGIRGLLNLYEDFLTNSGKSEAELVEQFLSTPTSQKYFAAAASFGDKVFEVIEMIGQHKRLHRLLVV